MKLRKEFITISEHKLYNRLRVRLHAQGIVLRDQVSGSEIKTKQQQVVRSGDFLVAEIDAKVGGFGIVPASLDGAIVSSHYFLFEADPLLLDERYLGWFIKTPQFHEQVTAQGSTNYAAIRSSDVMTYRIPLPTLSEQRRIVKQIEEIVRPLDAVRELRSRVSQEVTGLLRSIIFSDASAKYISVGELVRQRSPDVIVDPSETYRFAGVYSFGRGVFPTLEKQGLQFSYPRLNRLRTGDFVYPKLMAWEGALGVVPENCHGLVVSPEFQVFEIDVTKVVPEVLDIYFKMPSVWPKLSGDSTGTNVRRRRLNPSDFLRHKVPVPGTENQKLLQKVSQKIEVVKTLQETVAAELGAVVPAILDKVFRQSS